MAWTLCCLTVLALAAPLWAQPVGAVLERMQDAALCELYGQSDSFSSAPHSKVGS
ncbi:hypothetical protein AB0L39_31100 [Streptomyces parvus]|uniref:hypothetical protein n=1 Tax=Streptomyces parvus TaxID=66428 RepID=UPI00343B948A